MGDVKISRRGVYYDLNLSPYVINAYGDSYKFSSQKKMDIYAREIKKELVRYEKFVERHNLKDYIPEEIQALIKRAMYKALYEVAER